MSLAASKNILFFVLTAVVLAVCLILVVTFSGFQHETKKFRTILNVLICVLILQHLFWEPLRFIAMAIDHATWPQADQPFTEEMVDDNPSYISYLKTRLRARRSELYITDKDRNESLNEKYKLISYDLLLYGSYFLALLLTILVSEDQTLFYSTQMMDRLFNENGTNTMGLSHIYYRYQIYDYVKITLVDGFNVEKKFYGHVGWWAMEQWQRMGTVRLRQMRTENRHIGLGAPVWANTTYAPEWQLPYRRLHYTDKFWRVYDPFRPITVHPNLMDGLLLNFNHAGYLQRYPELEGYVALLMIPQVSAQRQVDYLEAYHWLDRNTCAVFIDFTLYNADANAFAMLTLMVENTPFGVQLPKVAVDCVKIVGTTDHNPVLQQIVLAIYFILVLHFMRGLVRKLWYDPSVIKNAWNLVDLVICLLNGFLMILWIVREGVTTDILERIESSTQSQFLELQRPLRLHMILTVVKGFLICITTLRLWKVLQFARVFQHFTYTLSAAWQAVVSLGVIIVVLLMGIGIALAVPNGNNALVFRDVVKAVSACLWYSVGFSTGISPLEFFHGGVLLGLLLYLLLVFLLAIILMNVFSTVIYHYFEITGHYLKEQSSPDHISFLEFLRAEYGYILRWCRNCCRCNRMKYYRNRRTVAQNVALAQQLQEHEKMQRDRYREVDTVAPTDEQQHAEYLRRIRHTFSVLAVLEVQMEILERLLLGDEGGNLPSPPSSPKESDSDREDKQPANK